MGDLYDHPSAMAGRPRGARPTTPDHSSDQEEDRELHEAFMKVRTVKIDFLREAYLRILTQPGKGFGEKIEAELLPFGFKVGDDGEITVALPKNAESYADNWIMLTTIAACKAMGATVESSNIAVDQLKYISERSEYLHGLAAAFKISAESEIIDDKTTGLFHQGFRWAVMKHLQPTVNKELYDQSYKDPYYAVTGKTVWTGDAPDAIKRWHSLMIKACSFIKLKDPTVFAKSPDKIIAEHVKQHFNYESLAVFSAEEVKKMSDYIGEGRSRLENFKKRLRDDRKEVIPNFRDLYSTASKEVADYDAQISVIAAKRASIIFRKDSTKSVQKKASRGLTREDRVAALPLHLRISVTNPSGLFGDSRVEFNPSKQDIADDNALLKYFEKWTRSITLKDTSAINSMFQSWMDYWYAELKDVISEQTD
jgi:hypothetical protein